MMKYDYQRDSFSHLTAISMGKQKISNNFQEHPDGIISPANEIEYGFVAATPQQAEDIKGSVKGAVLIPNTGLVIAPMSNLLQRGIPRAKGASYTLRLETDGYAPTR